MMPVLEELDECIAYMEQTDAGSDRNEVQRVGRRLARYAAGWKAEHDSVANRRDELQQELSARRAAEHKDVWYYSGDEYDHPESLTCPVLMEAAMLRHLLGLQAARQPEPKTKSKSPPPALLRRISDYLRDVRTGSDDEVDAHQMYNELQAFLR